MIGLEPIFTYLWNMFSTIELHSNKSTPDWTCTSNLRFKRPLLFYWVTGVYGGDGRNRTYIEFNNSHDLTGRCSAIEPHPQCSLHGAIWTLNLTNPNGADYQVFPRADVNNIFLKRIYKTQVPVSRIELEYKPYQDSTLPLCYTGICSASGVCCPLDSCIKSALLYCWVTEAYGGDGETRTLIPLQVTGVQAQTDTDFWLRLHNGTPNENRTHIIR